MINLPSTFSSPVISQSISIEFEIISFPSINEGTPGTGEETELQNFLYEDLKEAGFDKVEKISLIIPVKDLML